MTQINTDGLEVAQLSSDQLQILNNAQSEVNKEAEKGKEIYLLAVTR